jgi:hypothetical protein
MSVRLGTLSNGGCGPRSKVKWNCQYPSSPPPGAWESLVSSWARRGALRHNIRLKSCLQAAV